jgi:hypothetical protein
VSAYETLKKAITYRLNVRILAGGRSRDISPHALGVKGGKPRLLAYQYDGTSASGLAPGGQWRTFFLDEISLASPIGGEWHTAAHHNMTVKLETSLDRVDYQVRL